MTKYFTRGYKYVTFCVSQRHYEICTIVQFLFEEFSLRQPSYRKPWLMLHSLLCVSDLLWIFAISPAPLCITIHASTRTSWFETRRGGSSGALRSVAEGCPSVKDSLSRYSALHMNENIKQWFNNNFIYDAFFKTEFLQSVWQFKSDTEAIKARQIFNILTWKIRRVRANH